MNAGAVARTALVFPGMGPASFAEVGKFMVINPFARKLVAAADRRLGYSLVDRFAAAEGHYSEYAQVAFMVNCVALAQWAERALEVEPVAATGVSFGAKPAVAHVGALGLEDAVWMTAELARLQEDYFATEFRDLVTHSFVRAPAERLAEVLAELEDRGEWHEISCRVDSDFVMLTLRESNLDWLERRLRSIGALSLYTMRPPLHCTVFGALRERAEEEVIGRLRFADPAVPLLADQDGRRVTTAEGVRTLLLDGFDHAVRWPAVVSALRDMGVTRVCVAGQDTLFGRVPVTRNAFEVVPATPYTATRPRPRRAAGVAS
ncbi:malonyl CoA-acyl carrier protein transacylase [Planobispora rosea]|uniref:[acyl-carrier-protein] S-malonyltransferase n=2 Tax=Planobispora rosea TaxID=35762 RepID=A0A8J3WCV4_PLARO|nr:malonyl CoA-acyl carrier protein transacylase [Planobispora rosea]GIH84620.1 malonyl CoA-acyl carrier protein transacylase [Planobispora rosea]